MTEYIGRRTKMYVLRVDRKKDTKKVKGVKSHVVTRTITFDYTRCLNEELEMTHCQLCIRSKLHEIYTVSETKIALSSYDDKSDMSCLTLSTHYCRDSTGYFVNVSYISNTVVTIYVLLYIIVFCMYTERDQ